MIALAPLRFLGFLVLLVTTVLAQCPHEDVTLETFSSLFGGATSEQDITITAQQKVLLDVTPTVNLGGIVVNGLLVFAPTAVNLTAHHILIQNGGRLFIGSDTCPYTGQATITLTEGSYPDVANFGKKFIGVGSGGTLEIHGAEKRPAWTRLAATAAAGSQQITLQQPVEWEVGDRIVLVSTDFSMEQAEEFTITAVNSPTSLTLDRALTYSHFGDGAPGIPGMRGEVGLLSRNIVIQGDESSAAEKFGGHVKALEGFVGVHIARAEFTRLGQAGLLGVYPIHYHMAGNVSGKAYVRHNAIHHNYQRCVVVHGTHDLLVQGNVAHETFGHCYFIEDGIETGNVFDGNLGSNARCAPDDKGLLFSDCCWNTCNSVPNTVNFLKNSPSMFWITNPDNTFTNNVAVGTSHCYWYVMPEHPIGPSATDTVWPMRLPVRVFDNNIAHGCKNGLFVDEKLKNNDGTEGDLVHEGSSFPRVSPIPPASGPDPVTPSEFTNFVAYKISDQGIWARGGELVVRWSTFADCAIGATFAMGGSGNQYMYDSLFVGETSNLGTPSSSQISNGYIGLDGRSLPKPSADNGQADGYKFPIRGFEMYDGRVEIHGSVFRNFVPNALRDASAISTLRRNTFIIAMNQASGCVFDDVSTPVMYPDYVNDGDKNGAHIDLDGTCGGSLPNDTIIADHAFLLDAAACQRQPTWKAAVCQQTVGGSFMRMRIRPYEAAHGGGLTMYREDAPNFLYHMWGNGYSESSTADVRNYGVTVQGGKNYIIHGKTGVPERYLIFLDNVPTKEDKVRLAIRVNKNVVIEEIQVHSYHQVKDSPSASLAELDASTDGLTYYFDTSKGLLYLLFRLGTRTEGYNPHIFVRLSNTQQPAASCTQPGALTYCSGRGYCENGGTCTCDDPTKFTGQYCEQCQGAACNLPNPADGPPFTGTGHSSSIPGNGFGSKAPGTDASGVPAPTFDLPTDGTLTAAPPVSEESSSSLMSFLPTLATAIAVLLSTL